MFTFNCLPIFWISIAVFIFIFGETINDNVVGYLATFYAFNLIFQLRYMCLLSVWFSVIILSIALNLVFRISKFLAESTLWFWKPSLSCKIIYLISSRLLLSELVGFSSLIREALLALAHLLHRYMLLASSKYSISSLVSFWHFACHVKSQSMYVIDDALVLLTEQVLHTGILTQLQSDVIINRNNYYGWVY